MKTICAYEKEGSKLSKCSSVLDISVESADACAEDAPKEAGSKIQEGNSSSLFTKRTL